MKIADNIIPEFAAEVQRKDRNLKIGMVTEFLDSVYICHIFCANVL